MGPRIGDRVRVVQCCVSEFCGHTKWLGAEGLLVDIDDDGDDAGPYGVKLDNELLHFARVEPLSETVTTAAIRVDGVIWTLPRPARHHVLVRAWCLAHYKDGAEAHIDWHEQGFMTSSGRFVDRREAANIARAAKQTESSTNCLSTEDLW